MRGFCIRVMCFLVLMPAIAMSQGQLHGIITDSLSQKPLIGASVYLIGTALGGTTDLDGFYRIGRVPEGEYVMEVAYLGYVTKSLSVTVESGKNSAINLSLRYQLIQGDEEVITAQAEGQVAAINQQIRSNTIVNVVSEERIQELPDANAAESIGRLPGVALQRSGGEANQVVLRGLSPGFTSITVDGVRIASTDADARGVDLSTISQRSLAGIELHKALTADQDADAIAGSINLVTRSAPVDRVLRLDARSGYNGMDESYRQYDLVGRYSERLWNDRLGVQFTANSEQRDRSSEIVDLDYDVRAAGGTSWRITDLELNYVDEVRNRSGASLLLDYNTPEGGNIKLSNILSRTKRDFVSFTRNYPTDGDVLNYQIRDREQEIRTFNTFIKGDNFVKGIGLEWNVSYAQSQSDFPFDYEVAFLEPSATDAQGNPISHMGNIPTDLLQGDPEDIIPFALNNFERAYLSTANFRDRKNKEKEFTAYLNLDKEYNLGRSIAGTIKFGGKFRSKSRFREFSELFAPYYNIAFPEYTIASDGSIVAKEFAGTRFENLQRVGGNILVTNFLDNTPLDRDVFDRFQLYPMINRDAIRLWWDLNRLGVSDDQGRNPEYNRNLEPDAQFYDLTERVTAGYLMNTFNFGRSTSLITGVRVEVEDNDYASRYSPFDLDGFPVPTGQIRDTSAVHTETSWLPNAHLTVRPTDFMSVRLAAYKALARPDFNHRLENFVARKRGTFYEGNTLIIGNPGLEAAKAWNFELNTSLYDGYFGLFSISAFLKDIEDMFHVYDALPFQGQNALDSLGINYDNPFTDTPYILTYPFNSTQPTRVWGFETELQTQLQFLPGLLKNFVINGNISLVRSETYIPATELVTVLVDVPGIPFPVEETRTVAVENKQKLEGQPEIFGNMAIGYDFGGFSARLSMFHQGQYNTSFSADRRSDGLRDSLTRWDLALRHRITNMISVFMNFNNITNAEESTSIVNRVQNYRLVNQRDSFGFTADLGFRVQL